VAYGRLKNGLGYLVSLTKSQSIGTQVSEALRGQFKTRASDKVPSKVGRKSMSKTSKFSC